MSERRFSILDSYVRHAPGPQNAIDIFAGEWFSALPPPLEDVKAGGIRLFDAEHVRWGVEALGGVAGGRVLELGPLEGGHTYMIDRMGAREIVAVEANTRAYLKCLIYKELLGISSARFLCGDFVRYLERETAGKGPGFDLCLASGVLYHLADPVAALELMCHSSDRLVLWTHYYDEENVRSRPDLAARFCGVTRAEHRGFEHTLYRHEYGETLDFTVFCGGPAESSAWLPRDEILGAIAHFGFEVMGIAFEDPDHKNGPSFAVAARRRAGD